MIVDMNLKEKIKIENYMLSSLRRYVRDSEKDNEMLGIK